MKETTNLPEKYKFKFRDLIFGIVFILVSYILINTLLTLFNHQDFVKIKSIIKEVNIFLLSISFGLMLVAIFLRALKWKLLMNTSNYFPSLKSLFSSIATYNLSNSIIPRTGLLVRCYMLKKSENIPIDFTFGTIIIERIIDSLILSICILFSIILNIEAFFILFKKYNLENYKLLFFGSGFILLLIIIFLFFYRKTIKNKILKEINKTSILSNLTIGVKSYNKLNNKFYFIFLTVLSWVIFISYNFTFFYALDGVSLSFSENLFIFTIGIFGFLIPTPGGIGSYHAAIIIGFNILGLSPIYGLAFAFLSHAFQYISGIIIGLIGVFYSFWKSKKLETLTID